jgi:alpha-galactosidase
MEENEVMLTRFAFREERVERKRKAIWCPIVEVHVTGENPDDHHGAKHTGSSGSRTLKYVAHRYTSNALGNKLEFDLADGRMAVTVHYQIYEAFPAVRAWTVVTNIADEPLGLEYVSSFTYTGLDEGEGKYPENLQMYLPHNGWYKEANWRQSSLSDVGFERMSGTSTKRILLSNSGTWSTKEHLPMGAVVNTEVQSAWMWQIEHNGSWTWEISDIYSMMYLKISGPSEQENHWYKELKTGESFESVKVAVTVGADFGEALANMTRYRRTIIRNNAENEAMPVIFNDYMNCLLANPTEERELPMIDAAARTGAEYYCMDAGWYADGTWWSTVGEWQPCAWRFPNGIHRVFDYIREKGMIPGLWLEIEVMGIGCPLAKEWEDECFFLRHGKRVIDHGRYQLDFRHPKVRAHATEVVDRVVNEYGVGYIKMDYNIEAGIGTEVDADSFGDGLLQHNRAYLAWLDEIKEKYPFLILECCSSGGMRMDYAMLSRGHLQSISDQTSYKINSVIAAAASTAVLPEQSAIWSYPLAGADEDAVVVNMINAMMQRIHLSGKLTEQTKEGFDLICEGVACYKTFREELRAAIPFYPLGLPDYHGAWLCLAYRCEKRMLMAVWRQNAAEETVRIPMKECFSDTRILYPSDTDAAVRKEDGAIGVTLPRQYTAVLLEIC